MPLPAEHNQRKLRNMNVACTVYTSLQVPPKHQAMRTCRNFHFFFGGGSGSSFWAAAPAHVAGPLVPSCRNCLRQAREAKYK